ncbi:helix-turn-helix domain-containing protein, partial [Frankia casuarinae]
MVAGWMGITQTQLSRIESGEPVTDLTKLIRWA